MPRGEIQIAKIGRNRAAKISITIEWCEESEELKVGVLCGLRPTLLKQNRQRRDSEIRSDKRLGRTQRLRLAGTIPRLLPTDRIMLNALRERVPKGESITFPVSVKELMTECVISRRQVQICLKRLGENGLIRRLNNEVDIGSQKGFRYKILQT
jgi:hypothetical protein